MFCGNPGMCPTINLPVRTGALQRLPTRESAFMKYLKFTLHLGVPMPRYLTQHTLACLTRQGAVALAQRLQAGGLGRAEHVLVNMLEGKMFSVLRADCLEELEAWLMIDGMQFDRLVRLD